MEVPEEEDDADNKDRLRRILQHPRTDLGTAVSWRTSLPAGVLRPRPADCETLRHRTGAKTSSAFSACRRTSTASLRVMKKFGSSWWSCPAFIFFAYRRTSPLSLPWSHYGVILRFSCYETEIFSTRRWRRPKTEQENEGKGIKHDTFSESKNTPPRLASEIDEGRNEAKKNERGAFGFLESFLGQHRPGQGGRDGDEAGIARTMACDCVIKFLWQDYMPAYHWFEVFDLLRRIFFVAILPLLGSESMRATVGLFFSFLFALYIREAAPFINSATNCLGSARVRSLSPPSHVLLPSLSNGFAMEEV